MARKKSLSVDFRGNYKDIIFDTFIGIRNKGLKLDLNRPYFFINFDVKPDGSLIGRRKMIKKVDKRNSHSPFKISHNEYLFFATEEGFDRLYWLNTDTFSYEKIADTDSPGYRFWFVKIGDRVYISNKFWNCIYEVKGKFVRDWRFDSKYTFENAEEASDYAVAEAIGMPAVDNLCYYKGRIYGNKGNRLWYTEALFYDFTLPYYYIELPEEPYFILANDENIVVGMENMTLIGSVDERGISFRIEKIGAIKDSGIMLRNNIYFLTKQGLAMVGGKGIELIDEVNVDMSISGIAYPGKFIEDGYERGVIGIKRKSIDFKDDIIAEVIKKENPH